jgi:hypothetical protein
VIPYNALNSEFANFETPVYLLIALRPGCIKRCQVVVKYVKRSDWGYLTFYLNQPIKWAGFRLDALLADTMLTKPENFVQLGQSVPLLLSYYQY